MQKWLRCKRIIWDLPQVQKRERESDAVFGQSFRSTGDLVETTRGRPCRFAVINHQRNHWIQGEFVAPALFPDPNNVAQKLEAGHLVGVTLVLQKQINQSFGRGTTIRCQLDRIQDIGVALSQVLVDKRPFLQFQGSQVERLDHFGWKIRLEQTTDSRQVRERIVEEIGMRRWKSSMPGL